MLISRRGDYTGVLINIADNRDLTFTSANADDDPYDLVELGTEVSHRSDFHRTVRSPSMVSTFIRRARSAGFADGNLGSDRYSDCRREPESQFDSLVTIDATSDPTPGQALWVWLPHTIRQSIEVDHVHFGPYRRWLRPDLCQLRHVYVNGSSDPLNTINITNNEFEAGTTRNVARQASPARWVARSRCIEGNSFEEPGTAQGAIRID